MEILLHNIFEYKANKNYVIRKVFKYLG